jgi:hypothetical protein
MKVLGERIVQLLSVHPVTFLIDSPEFLEQGGRQWTNGDWWNWKTAIRIGKANIGHSSQPSAPDLDKM